MEVKVATDRKEVVLDIIDLLLLAEDVYILHLLVSQLIESLNELLLELKGVLVLSEVSQPLVNEPYVHVRDGVVNVEIVLDIHCVDELPRVNVEQESRQKSSRLNERAFLASLEGAGVCHPRNSSADLRSLLDIHVSIHAGQGLVEIKWSKARLCSAEVFRVVHAIVDLILVLVEI